ncbi:MAG: type II toxin-antitoxin system VapC family toxin [Nitratireductor sp.]|nr:type II toxin-antitoxin system VapC family toxin [Nitratireductor sp.]
MIGLDTNVLVRYIAQDDAAQSPKATRLIESLTAENPAYIGLVSLTELVWVLTGCYSSSKEDMVAVLEGLLRTKGLLVENAETVWKAVRLFKGGSADFADCLIECSANRAGCDYTATFDRGAAKHCGMRLIA